LIGLVDAGNDWGCRVGGTFYVTTVGEAVRATASCTSVVGVSPTGLQRFVLACGAETTITLYADENWQAELAVSVDVRHMATPASWGRA